MAGDMLPYLKFYPAEALSDERFDCWTFAERGVWLTLLFKAWVNGTIPDDLEELARLLHTDATALRPLWDRIKDRFIPHPDEPGRLTSRRLEEEREDARAKSKAGQKGAKSRWRKKHAVASEPHCDRSAEAMPQSSAAQRNTEQRSAVSEEAAAAVPAQSPAAGPVATEDDFPVRRLEVVDEGGGYDDAGPSPVQVFRRRLADRMARTAPLPVGGTKQGDVFAQVAAALEAIPMDEAVEIIAARDRDACRSGAKATRPRTLALVAMMLADEVSRRKAANPEKRRLAVGVNEQGEPIFAEAT